MRNGLKFLDKKVVPFLPVSTFMVSWYFIVIVGLTVDYFVTVFYICFQSFKEDFSWRTIALPLELLILILDILISLNTSFIENGIIISEK